MDRKLINYLPPILRNIREFVVITDAQQAEIEKAWDALSLIMDNQFIDTATEEAVSIWEKEYGIIPKSQELDTRKFVLRTKQHEKAINSFRSVYERLKSLCGAENFQLSINVYNLEVKLALGISEKYNAVVDMLREIVPANILIDVQIMYNKNDVLTKYTHLQLSSYTHNRLRNEVFN